MTPRPHLFRRVAGCFEQALAEYLLWLLSPALDERYVRRGPAPPGIHGFDTIEEGSGNMRVQRLIIKTQPATDPSNAAQRSITYSVNGGPESSVTVDLAAPDADTGLYLTKLPDAFDGGETVTGRVTDYDKAGNPAPTEFVATVNDTTPPDAPGVIGFETVEETVADA